MTVSGKRSAPDSSGKEAKKTKNTSSSSSEEAATGGGGSDPNNNKTENESVENGEKSEFGGKSLEAILKERSVSDSIINACSQYKITTIARLRKLRYNKLVEYFKDEGENFCFIDWKHIEGLWSGDVLPVDYIPPLRKQCKEGRVDLKYAMLLEDMDVTDLKDVDEATLQEVQEKAKEDDSSGEADESTSDEGFDPQIENLRCAVGKARDGKSGGDVGKFRRRKRYGKYTGEEEADEDGDEEPTDEDSIDAREQADLVRQEADKMRQGVKDALAEINTDELAQMQAEDLKAKLDDLKSNLEKPVDVYDVDKNRATFEDQMNKLNTDAIFMSSTDYIPPYTDNKDLVAAASGGIALNGIGVFTDKDKPLVSSTMPLLAPPDHVTTLGTFSAFEAKILKTTSEYEAASFQSNASSFGMSMAESVQSETSASASFSGRYASASASAAHAKQENSAGAKQNDSNSSSFNNLKTQTAQITEYIVMPMRSFRIPRTAVKLSDEAIYELAKIKKADDFKKSRAFISKFGTHVSRGRHTMGGIFFRKISMTSDESQSANKMFSSAGEQLEKSKKSSTEVSAETAVKFRRRGGGVAASRAQSKGSSSSMGSLTVGANEDGSGGSSCTYTFESRCLGPNASSPEEFANVLQANNAIWACIDRGDPTNLLGIWEVIEEESRQINEVAKIVGRKAEKKALTNAEIANLLKGTWFRMLSPRKRALWNENPSIKHLLRESNRDIYDKLSESLISFCEPLSYVDIDKFKVFKRAVSEAIAVMVHRPMILPPATWIKDFLSFGRAALSDVKDKKIFDSMMKYVDVKANQDAAGHAANFGAQDWIRFNRAFHEVARAHWTMQQQARALLPAAGVQFSIGVPTRGAEIRLAFGKPEEKTQIFPWKPDHKRHPNCMFMAVLVKDGVEDGSFALQIVKDPTMQVDEKKTPGTNCHLYPTSKEKKYENQRFILYKPLGSSNENEVLILSWKDRRYGLALGASDFSAVLKTDLWKNNECPFFFDTRPVDKSERLSEILLSFQASPITYVDQDKLQALKCAVQNSSEVMAESIEYFPAANWLQNFLLLGKASLSSTDKSSINAMTKNIDVKLQQEAADIAATFIEYDWGRFIQCFNRMALEYWERQQQAKRLIPTAGVEFSIGVPTVGEDYRLVLSGGHTEEGSEIHAWPPDNERHINCMCAAEHLVDGSFALQFTNAKPMRVDERKTPGTNCHLYPSNKEKKYENQKFILYKPWSSPNENKVLILSWKDRRYGLAIRGSGMLKTDLWKNNECPFYFELNYSNKKK